MFACLRACLRSCLLVFRVRIHIYSFHSLFVCLFVCLFACLLACLIACLLAWKWYEVLPVQAYQACSLSSLLFHTAAPCRHKLGEGAGETSSTMMSGARDRADRIVVCFQARGGTRSGSGARLDLAKPENLLHLIPGNPSCSKFRGGPIQAIEQINKCQLSVYSQF